MPKLPNQEEVFTKYFKPWYDKDELEYRGHEETLPDTESWGKPGAAAELVSPLTDEGQKMMKEQIEEIYQAAKEDWPDFLGVKDEVSLDWVEAFDQYFDKEKVAELLENSDPEEFSNELVVLSCELGAVIGNSMIQEDPELKWMADCPYWESAIYDIRTGFRVNVFHWAIKKFSSYEHKDGIKARILQCLEDIKNSQMQ